MLLQGRRVCAKRDLDFEALGLSKTDEFLKENHDVHFCVLSAPDPASEPKKMTQKRPK